MAYKIDASSRRRTAYYRVIICIALLSFVQSASSSAQEVGKTLQIITAKKSPVTLSLDDCIQIAVKNHIPLQVAEKNVRLARARLLEARRNMLPTVTARFEDYTGKVNERNYIGKKALIEGQQTVFHGGNLYFTMKQAEVNLEVVKTDYMRVKNDLVLQVRKAYYSLAKAKENLKIQEELHRDVSNIYDMVGRAFEAGLVPRLEVLNVTSQTNQTRYQLTAASGDIAVSNLILKQAMYMSAEQRIDIEPRLEFRKIDVDFDKLLFTALVNRPEMKINSLMLEYYRYEKKIANAKGWWPKIDILGHWGKAMEEYTEEDNQLQWVEGSTGNPWQDAVNVKMQEEWYAGFKVSLPVWGSTVEYSYTREQWVPVVSAYQGTEASTNTVVVKLLDNMKSISEMRSADVDFDKARQELAKAQNDVTLDVRESYFNYQKAVMQHEVATSKVEYQSKDLEAVRAKREMEEAQDSNVVESMIKLAQERFSYVQALTDYYIALSAMNKAVGIEDYFKTSD